MNDRLVNSCVTESTACRRFRSVRADSLNLNRSREFSPLGKAFVLGFFLCSIGAFCLQETSWYMRGSLSRS